MATRTQARESVVGLLYAYDLGNESIVDYAQDMLQENKIRNKQQEFALDLFQGTIKHIKEIDELLNTKLNERKIDEIGQVEKAILRQSTYEIIFAKTPKAIIINEAIELSKKLASDSAPKFVNGVLDALEVKSTTKED
jgi:N utilization substance protein B